MENKDQEEKLDVTPDKGMELSEEQADGIAGGRWSKHQPSEHERQRHNALKRQRQQTEEPPELLDY